MPPGGRGRRQLQLLINRVQDDSLASEQTKESWTESLTKKRDFLVRQNPTSVFIPANTGSTGGTHWILMQILTAHNRLLIYDSGGAADSHRALATRVAKWWGADTAEGVPEIGAAQCIKQKDGHNCGPMVCLNLRRLMLKRRRPRALRDWGYDSGQMEYWRWHIINELAKDKLMTAETRTET